MLINKQTNVTGGFIMTNTESICYLDCNATTPVEPEVIKIMVKYLEHDYGNPSSRTHEYGRIANQAVSKAREQVAAVIDAEKDEVIFTSGATESNNLVIFGLAEAAEKQNKKHIISTQIEHKAILEPLQELEKRGFEITLLPPTSGGWVDPEELRKTLRDDTFLVSIMHVNNETGIIQPLEAYVEILKEHTAYFHTDAAQGYGKEIDALKSKRIDLISISGHKIYGPKGIGALIARKRDYVRPPIKPMMFGGGQERKIRPGTLATHQIAGLGKAAELAVKNHARRKVKCQEIRDKILGAFTELSVTLHGDLERQAPHVLNMSFGDIDSEAIMVALKDTVAISNGSACNSTKYELSHVLESMQLPLSSLQTATRWSWCHLGSNPNLSKTTKAIKLIS